MKRFFRRIRFYNHIIKAFWQKRKKLFILGFLFGVASFFLTFYLFHIGQEKVEKIGLVGKFTINELPLEIQGLISEGLTQVDENGSPKPSLANSWEIRNDGKEYIFTLKDNLFWQDGKELLANEINLKFNDVAAAAIDQKNIKFMLKEAFSPFLSVVSKPIFRTGLLGTGEYKVKGITKNGQTIEKLTLVPTKDKTKPKKIFRFYPTEETARDGFKLGEVDLLKDIIRPEDLLNWKKVEVSPEIKTDRFVAIFFNTTNSFLEEKSTRQALAYAIRKNWSSRALNPINPSSWAYNKDVKPYDYDLENAKKLLNGNGNEQNNSGKLKEIELSTFSSLLPVAEQIKKDWEELGIITKIRVINSVSEGFQALLATQEIPSDPDQYLFWHSTQTTNISNYKSPKIDKLLEDGRKTSEEEKRKPIYQDFQRFLVEDTPAIFLFHPTVYNIFRK